MKRPHAFSTTVGGVSLILAMLGTVALGCVSSELELPATHPAHPRARLAEVHSTKALTQAYALENGGEPVSEGISSGAHTRHDHGSDAPDATVPHRQSTESPAAVATFTCPMHPEIVRAEPGSCPICGMNLVPQKGAK
jgi:hypothetical protein